MKIKKSIFTVIFLLIGVFIFSESLKVKVIQNVQIPGGQYAIDVPSPAIKYSQLSNGNINIRYNFDLNAEKDDKNSLIDCKIEIPSGINYFVTSFDGLQSFEFDGEQIPALIENNNYAEFFIPVRKEGNGFIEIQLTIPQNYVGSDIPIKVSFERYKRKENIVFSTIATVIFGIPGAIISGIRYYMNREQNTKMIEEKFDTIKDKYKKFYLLDSLKHYRIQVR